jgi:hypothetical protein
MTNMTNIDTTATAKKVDQETALTDADDRKTGTALRRVRVGQRSPAEHTAAVKAQIAAAKAEGHEVINEGGRQFIVQRLASGMTIRMPVG